VYVIIVILVIDMIDVKQGFDKRSEKMVGDVWVEKNAKGQVVLCIDIGNGKVSKKVIKKQGVKK